ncbi:MAG: tRNA-specific adenosine deaminase [Chloroflexi bacterium]|nr:MAG: tRNA-specific adenosine deaminase [Chloroflexota bacterium]
MAVRCAAGGSVNYELYMAEAIAEARLGAEEGETPVGAVAVLDDAMIARDHDRMQLQRDPTAHAVLLTLQAASRKLEPRRLSEVTIFTTREPCAMCVGALVETQVRSLVYAAADDRRGAAGSVIQLARHASLPHQISVVSGVREAEARRLDQEASARP